MGQKPINKMFGRKGLSALLLALAMLVVATAGAASAEAGAQSLENDDATLEAAKAIESDYLLVEALMTDDGELDDNLSDVEPIDDGGNVVIFVWTNGEDALVVVVLFDEDGNWTITHMARMTVEEAREKLADFEGRIIVRHVSVPDVQPLCPHGYVVAKWQLNQTSLEVAGTFQGLWLNADSTKKGKLVGVFSDGEFSGRILSRNGTAIGLVKGEYANGHFRGLWEVANSQGTTDEVVTGTLHGNYGATGEGTGVMRGKWVQGCEDGPSILPMPIDPPIDCTISIALDDGSKSGHPVGDCKVEPLDRESERHKPALIDEKQKSGELESIKEDAQELLETELVETDGGFTVDVGDAAAGGALSSIPLLGVGLIRRRFML